MCNPLFICQHLFQSFDEIQINLLGESQMWKLPKSLYLSLFNPRSIKDCLVFREKNNPLEFKQKKIAE